MAMIRMRLAFGAAALLLSAGLVQAAMMPDEVSKKIAQQFAGVKVLRVIGDELDGRRIFNVRVMVAGGNSNDAFRVDTLIVDAETGQLLRAFRHLPAGYALAGSKPSPDVNRNDTSVPADGRVWR